MLENTRADLSFSRVSVIGLGYIGLPTAAILASRKVHVIGVDISAHTVETINRGAIHIIEPELDIVVHAAVMEGYLRATTIPEPADAFLIAVPTPFKENHQPDLSYIKDVCNAIAPVLKKEDLIILESTSPVGTTEQVEVWLSHARPDLTFPLLHGKNSDIRIAYCPERVLPGHILRELIQNSRVIGGMTSKCSHMAKKLYEIFVEGECIVTDSRTAEMCKLTENSYRDVNIAFANELSLICDKLDINIWELIKLANHHPRVNILQAGPGVGGHCIAVDPWFIVTKTPDEARLIRTAREVNDYKPEWVVEKVKRAVEGFLKKNQRKTAKDVTIACLGLTFKADIDDLRESPAVAITKKIAECHSGNVIAVEPNIRDLPSTLFGLVELKSIEQAIPESNIILVLVNHKLFKQISVNIDPQTMIIDACGAWVYEN